MHTIDGTYFFNHKTLFIFHMCTYDFYISIPRNYILLLILDSTVIILFYKSPKLRFPVHRHT